MKSLLTRSGVWLTLPALAVMAVGCATGGNETSRALVCPECETVLLEPAPQPALSPDEEGIYYSSSLERERRQHTCPGCQGALTTLFKEGKLKHQCSVCSQGAFRCPIDHR